VVLAELDRRDDPLSRYVALVNRSALRLRQDRPAKALADLHLAVKLRPRPQEAVVNMARVYERRQDWGAASAALSRAIELRPDAALYHARARAHARHGARRAARADFEKAIAQEPAGGRSELLLSALVELGHLKHEAGEHTAALADVETAQRLRPDYAPALRQQAMTLLALRRHAEAGKALDRYLAGGQRQAKYYLARGLIHTRMGEHAEAIELYSAALRLGPDAATRQHRGWAYLQRNSPPLALADFEAALRLGPRTYQALCGRATARVRLRQVEEGVKDAEAALKLPDATGPEAPLLAAGVFATAAGIAAETAAPTRGRAPPGTRYLDRAAELLVEAIRRVPERDRAAFWRTRVQKEETLAEVRRHPRVARLVRTYER
jgi:tetratricopeptide (TPR) repeat protein